MSIAVNARTIMGFWLMIGIALLPIYLWSSGGMQISHVVLFGFSLSMLAFSSLRLDMAAKLLGLLAVYAAVRDSVFAVRHTNVESVVPVFYILFIWFVFISLRSWFTNAK